MQLWCLSIQSSEKSALNISRTNPSRDGGDCSPLAPSLRCYPLTFKRARFCCPVKPSQLWCGLFPLAPSMRFSALSFAPHYILASLVKGRWIDGKAQTVALLRFTCDTPAFFIHHTFLPSRRRDCRPRKRASFCYSVKPSQLRW